MKLSHSNRLFDRARQSVPGGVNSPARAFKAVGMKPLFIERAKGSKVYDADGNEFIDYVGSWGPMILGHANEIVVEALAKAARDGVSYGAPTELEIVMAELVKEFFPSMDLVRMVNSGTEAAMSAIRLARAHKGRDKIVKFIGCYHGHADYLLVKAGSAAATLGVPDSPGVPADFGKHTLLAGYNRLDEVRELFDAYPEEIAAVVVEPIAGNMGFVLPRPGFLQGLRELCDRYGALLLFDEVMTGFRVARGGAQELFGVVPDLSCLGKVIGGGLPVGCYGGRRELMEKVAPLGKVYQAGTLSGNPLAMIAGIETLKVLRDPEVYRDLSEKTSLLIQGWKDVARKRSVPFQADFACSMFGFFFSENEVRDFDSSAASDIPFFVEFFKRMLAQGVYLAPSSFEAGFMSACHEEDEIERTIRAFDVAVRETLESRSVQAPFS